MMICFKKLQLSVRLNMTTKKSVCKQVIKMTEDKNQWQMAKIKDRSLIFDKASDNVTPYT